MQVPPQIHYNQLQTKAFFSVYKQWPIQPIANGGQYWPGQVIRIFLNALTEGVMDPYKSHIQITVSCDISTLPVGLLQVDSSAQSFIQQMVITSKNRQVQRIIQYGCLAAYLTDIGISELYSQGRQTEGLGYSNIDTYSGIYSKSFSSPNAGLVTDMGVAALSIPKAYSSPGTILPTIPNKIQTFLSTGSQYMAMSPLSGIYRSHASQLNTAWMGDMNEVYYWYQAIYGPGEPDCNDPIRTTSLNYYGYLNNIRAQYLSSYLSNNYIDSTTSLCQQQIRLQDQVQNNLFPARFNNNTQYATYVPQYLRSYHVQDAQGVVGDPVIYDLPNSTAIQGFTNLISPNFSKGVRQPFISPTVAQCQFQHGMILPVKQAISRRKFKIPLISAVLGLLIPQSQFVLLPLRALNDLLIELTIDPYAMFTSGYSDISQFDYTGMGIHQNRSFKVERLIYNLHTYQFYNPQIDQYLKISLSSGIAINTHFWQMGNQYQIQLPGSITNSWPVACNQQALNEILIMFYSLQYMNFTFCRKHFRLSNNIQRMQFRINMDYFPSQPLSGYAGNPVEMIANQGDNSVFLEQIMMSNGYSFNKQSPMPRINAYNFAINGRCYNTKNTHTFYDPSMINNPQYQWSNLSINVDTAMGMANVHQNRFVGKAAYLFSFQPYSHSKNFLTGIDCRQAKQFDVIFTNDPQNTFQGGPQMMLIYTRSSVIMQYSRDGVRNVNK